MAGFEIMHSQSDIDELFNIDFDDIAESSLKEAAPILEASMKSAVGAVIEHEGDSELVAAIATSSPTKSKNGAWIVNVGPKGYSKTKVYHDIRAPRRTYKVSNALKAIWKEYGVAGRQPARPFLAKATNDAKSRVIDVIQGNFEKKAGAE